MNMLHPLFALLASVTKQELARQVAYLKAENRILRARLPKRIIATERERSVLIRAGRKLGGRLRELISIVAYDTLRRWVREASGSRGRNRNPGVWVVPGPKPKSGSW